jgi:hypothetical protein
MIKLSNSQNIDYISKNKFNRNIVDESDLSKKAQEIKIIEFVKIIWNQSCPIIELKQLKNGYYLGYTNDKLFIFDNKFNFLFEIKELDDTIFYISELISDNPDKKINLGVITIKNFFIIKINLDNSFYEIENYDYNGIFFLQISQTSFIFGEGDCFYFYNDIFDKICQQYSSLIYRRTVPCGLFLNESKNIGIFTSNEILPNGDAFVRFYDRINKEIYKEFPGSFTLSCNGITLIESENKNNKKILLSACKKYKKYQKNGILICISSFNKFDDKIFSKFHDTENFEVYCFCQILLNKDPKNWNKSDYFFVSGFNNDTRQGLIKLYKAYFNEKEEENKIEFVVDIIIEKQYKNIIQIFRKKSKEELLKTKIFSDKENNEYTLIQINQNFNGFKGPVTSIIQSNITGNILVSCFDGNIYLFTPPNLDYYICNEID